MKRRAFLIGIGATTALPLAPVANAAPMKDAVMDPGSAPQGAVFGQQTYYSFDGSGAAYTPPAANRSTVDYRAGLSEEEFLRRHWFS